MRAVMVKGASAYDGTRLFIDEAAAAFQRAGHTVEIVDLTVEPDHWAALERAGAGGCDLVFSINFLGESRRADGRTAAQVVGAPHVVWHVDYVLSQEPRLKATPRETAMLLVDHSQVDALNSVMGQDRYAHVGFCPHAAVGQAAPEDPDADAFQARRDIPILLSCTLTRPGPAPWAGLGARIRAVFDDAFDLAMAADWMRPLDALDQAMRARGMTVETLGLTQGRLAAAALDSQIRLTRRFAFVRALAKTGLPVHIRGRGWERDLYRFGKAAAFGGEATMAEVAGLMARSRIVLNTNGNFGEGSHERPLSALLAGACVFTDESRFYAEAFGQDEGLVSFRWSGLDGAMAQLAALHADPARAHALARAGQKRVMAEHLWDHRVPVILDAARAAADRWRAAA